MKKWTVALLSAGYLGLSACQTIPGDSMYCVDINKFSVGGHRPDEFTFPQPGGGTIYLVAGQPYISEYLGKKYLYDNQYGVIVVIFSNNTKIVQSTKGTINYIKPEGTGEIRLLDYVNGGVKEVSRDPVPTSRRDGTLSFPTKTTTFISVGIKATPISGVCLNRVGDIEIPQKTMNRLMTGGIPR